MGFFTGLFLRESDILGSTARCLFWTQSVYACYCKTNYVFASGYCLEGNILIALAIIYLLHKQVHFVNQFGRDFLKTCFQKGRTI